MALFFFSNLEHLADLLRKSIYTDISCDSKCLLNFHNNNNSGLKSDAVGQRLPTYCRSHAHFCADSSEIGLNGFRVTCSPQYSWVQTRLRSMHFFRDSGKDFKPWVPSLRFHAR